MAALGSVKTLFGIEELNFVCTQVDERTDATVYWLDQLWQGIPVSGYGFRVEAGADGAAQFVSGSYLQGISVDVSGALELYILSADGTQTLVEGTDGNALRPVFEAVSYTHLTLPTN